MQRDYDPPSPDEPWYDPRGDPFFRDKLLACLSSSPGQRVEPMKMLGIDRRHRYVVRDAVRSLRSQGFDIRGDARIPGYRYIGYVETGHLLPVESTPLEGVE